LEGRFGREDQVAPEEKLAIAVIERAVMDLKGNGIKSRNKNYLIIRQDAQRFLSGISKTFWGETCAPYLNLTKLSKWAKSYRINGG
jgi:hypothetical protein